MKKNQANNVIMGLLLLAIGIASCTQTPKKKLTFEEKMTELVAEWINQTMVLPEDLQAKVQGRDTICDDLWDRPYRLLIPIDSTGCTECKLKLYEWKILLDSINRVAPNKLMPLMVVYQSDYLQLERFAKRDRFDYPMFYDRQNSLITQNKLSSDIRYNVFLLDRNNKVLALGNPILYPSISELYLKIIQGEGKLKDEVSTTAEIDPQSLDLDTINYHSSKVQKTTIRNTGKHPLVLYKAETSCNCTEVDYPKQLIAPGKEASISITYKPNGLGHIAKKVRLYGNFESHYMDISITGVTVE